LTDFDEIWPDEASLLLDPISQKLGISKNPLAAAAIFKSRKITVSCNKLMDFDEIWYVDASRPMDHYLRILHIQDGSSHHFEKNNYKPSRDGWRYVACDLEL